MPSIVRGQLAVLGVALLTGCATAPASQSRVASAPTGMRLRTVVPGDESNASPGTMVLAIAPGDGACATDDMCAVRAVLDQIMFRGVPGSRQPSPIVADEKTARDGHKTFFDGVLARDEGRRYVSNISRNADRSYVVVINADLLRNDLVKEGIIRRFGY